jgi:Bacterial protein of unknown function (DUF885)
MVFKSCPFGRCLGAALVILLNACSGPKPAAAVAPPAAHDAWPEFAAGYIESSFKADPFFAVQAGRHEFDGQMADWSAQGFSADIARLHQLKQQAEAFDPGTLTPAERFEREYVQTLIASDLFWLERARTPFSNPAWYIDRLDPDVYLNRDYAPLEKRLQGYLGYLRTIPKIAADIRANLQGPLPPSFVERGIDGFGGFADFYRKDAPKVFASVQDPAAQQQLTQASAAAADAMAGLKSWLQGEKAHATGSFALGEPLFLEMLKTTEQVDVPIAELLAIGRADLDRNTQALKDACGQYLPGATLQACVAKMRADKPSGGAVDGARAQLGQLRSYIVAKNIVSIPSDEVPQVAEAPPYNRANAAYINIPGPYDKNVAYTYDIAPPDPAWSAKEREEYIPGTAVLLYTSVHEVWPGHFLQFLHANRNPSKIAALWVGYAYAEGWAHYCEEMMWEEGLGDGNAQQHIGQLTEALLRDVRYLSAIGLHTQGMKLAQSDHMFRDSGFQDPGDARQQAARGTYDPQYLDYTLGKLMIRKLRADWVAAQKPAAGSDPRSYWHDFHDRFLSYGGPPIPMVRREMLGDASGLF